MLLVYALNLHIHYQVSLCLSGVSLIIIISCHLSSVYYVPGTVHVILFTPHNNQVT